MPDCNDHHHGFELLATIDGMDTKFSCNIAHGMYSWLGAASEGGYIGSDPFSFLSAVLSHAAGDGHSRARCLKLHARRESAVKSACCLAVRWARRA